jgi:hypothetical protein
LGEIETGFVIWYRAEKNDCSVSVSPELMVSSCDDFRLSISAGTQIVVVNARLPTIQDLCEVASLRRAVTVTQIERTKLTLELNR